MFIIHNLTPYPIEIKIVSLYVVLTSIGNKLLASHSHQTSAPSLAIRSATAQIMSFPTITLPSSLKNAGIGTPHTRWRDMHQVKRLCSSFVKAIVLSEIISLRIFSWKSNLLSKLLIPSKPSCLALIQFYTNNYRKIQ